MRRLLLALLAVMTLSLAAPLSALADDDDDDNKADRTSAIAYVVHGIPGGDLGLPAALPVDVSVNGACAIPGFTFGTITDGIPLPAGDYTIAISLANPAAPCAETPVVGPLTVTLAARTSYAIVAHLTEAGAPTASLFKVNTSEPSRARSRVIVHHTAAAPAVDITLSRRGDVELGLAGVRNGAQGAALVTPNRYDITIAPAGSDTPVFTATNVRLLTRNVYLVFAVGTPGTGSFTLLTKAIDRRDD